ncbi:MAG: RsmB/NOP family class I SAM-dependent RNA methyltransferase [Thermoplasmata archaeon]|nr:MAG: RsmB/NOP family class I SAM-dependent RNA methyltransferase [Thermoplasmata archaeon]
MLIKLITPLQSPSCMDRRLRRVAERAVDGWLKGDQMARVLRRTLPSSGLTLEERERVAGVVHRVVRHRRLYEYILERKGFSLSPASLVKIALGEVEWDEGLVEDAPPPIRLSCSEAVSEILLRHVDYVERINREPETFLAVNLRKCGRREVKSMLEREGMAAEEFMPETALRTVSRGRYSKAAKEGLAHVQDPSSQLVAKITALLGGDVLDYCAGNGGKSLTMAYYGAPVFAYDKNRGKLRNLERRAEIYRVPVRVEWWPREHDVVLVDAPCSGLGAAARNPEVKYYRDLKGFPVKQKRILSEASRGCRRYLIYSVCTFTEEETEGVVEDFLGGERGFEPLPPEEVLPGILFSEELKYVRYRGRGAIIELSDIMYIAILERK